MALRQGKSLVNLFLKNKNLALRPISIFSSRNYVNTNKENLKTIKHQNINKVIIRNFLRN